MLSNKKMPTVTAFEPGEVLALFTPLQELEVGLYLLHNVEDGWIVLRKVIDDEKSEQLILTNEQARLPVKLLVLFMPIGLQLPADKGKCVMH